MNVHEILAFSTVTVVYLVAKPLNRNEAESDHVLIETWGRLLKV